MGKKKIVPKRILKKGYTLKNHNGTHLVWVIVIDRVIIDNSFIAWDWASRLILINILCIVRTFYGLNTHLTSNSYLPESCKIFGKNAVSFLLPLMGLGAQQ